MQGLVSSQCYLQKTEVLTKEGTLLSSTLETDPKWLCQINYKHSCFWSTEKKKKKKNYPKMLQRIYKFKIVSLCFGLCNCSNTPWIREVVDTGRHFHIHSVSGVSAALSLPSDLNINRAFNMANKALTSSPFPTGLVCQATHCYWIVSISHNHIMMCFANW